MRVLAWLVRAFLFFALFAFALNNRHEVIVHWFFGAAWTVPLVILVLVAFGAGCVLGILAMVPSWWRRRAEAPVTTLPPRETAAPLSEVGALHPPREGL